MQGPVKRTGLHGVIPKRCLPQVPSGSPDVHVHQRGALRMLQQAADDDLQRAPAHAQEVGCLWARGAPASAKASGSVRKAEHMRHAAPLAPVSIVHVRVAHVIIHVKLEEDLPAATRLVRSAVTKPRHGSATAGHSKLAVPCTRHAWAHQVHGMREMIVQAAAPHSATQQNQRWLSVQVPQGCQVQSMGPSLMLQGLRMACSAQAGSCTVRSIQAVEPSVSTWEARAWQSTASPTRCVRH